MAGQSCVYENIEYESGVVIRITCEGEGQLRNHMGDVSDPTELECEDGHWKGPEQYHHLRCDPGEFNKSLNGVSSE